MKTKILYFAIIGASLIWFTGFRAFAVNPPPDGGYPGKNTAEGQDALFRLTNGTGNTGLGFAALKANTMGDRNTGNGAFTLFSNQTGSENTATGYAALFLTQAPGIQLPASRRCTVTQPEIATPPTVNARSMTISAAPKTQPTV